MNPFIIIPAYNEEQTISKVVETALSYIANVVVVNDASTDKTALLAKNSGAFVITSKSNLGYDSALECGISYALNENATSILTLDADGQHPHEFIPIMIDIVQSNAFEMVLGARRDPPRMSERIFSLTTNYMYNVKDITCGMKCYSADLCRKYGFGSHLRSIGTYLALKAIKNGVTFYNIEIPVKERKDKSRFGFSFKSEFAIISAALKSFMY